MSQSKPFADFSPGVSNRFPPNKLETRLATNMPASYLRDAVNCDVTAKGTLVRRPGYRRALTANVRDLWGDGADDGYAVIDGVLCRLDAALTTTPLVDVGTARVSMSRGPDGTVCWSDGTVLERIVGATSASLLPATPVTPVVTVVAGSLPAGRYMMAFTAVGAGGESAASWPITVPLDAPGGIALSGCVPGTLVYMTGPNGEIMTFVGMAEGPAFSVVSLVQDGRRCETAGLVPMPSGQIVRHALGRLLVASGATLYMSEPYRYGLMDPASGFMQFEAPITVIAPTQGGLYVAADQTYWFGQLPPTESRAVLPFGALPRSDVTVPASSDLTQRAAWMSPRGLVIADEGGEVTLPQDAALNFSTASRASTILRESAGERWLVTTRVGVEPMISKARNAGT